MSNKEKVSKINEQQPAAIKKDLEILRKLNYSLARILPIPLKEKLFFTQYLAIMLKAGISLAGALYTLAKQTTNPYFAAILRDVGKSVEEGVTLNESLKKYEKIFGELYVNMIESGEASGRLEEVLDYLYIQMKKSYELTSKVKTALAYPTVIIVAMGGIVIFLMVVVMPKLTELLRTFGASLPLTTQILIGLSEWVANNGLLLLFLLVILFVSLVFIGKTGRGKYFYHWLTLKVPVFSPIVKKVNLARFARTLSSLLKTDIMIVKTFDITANTLGNVVFRRAVKDMSDQIKEGKKINEIVNLYPDLFPPVVNHIMLVGEETGELDSMLGELAGFYEGEVEKVMDTLPQIIEPVLILLLGLGVGFIAVAIIMPIYSMTMSV